MKNYIQYVECADCGRKIPACNAHRLNGKFYGYSCYRKQLAMLYKQWEDEKNAEYSAKCFAAMQIFEGKKSNSFHDSICKQWNVCKKLTARQLECIIKGFTDKENIEFWMIWQQLSNDECLKWSIPSWIEKVICKAGKGYGDYIDNEAFINCMLYDHKYKRRGFHFFRDYEYSDGTNIYIDSNGVALKEDLENELVEVLKVVEGIRK